MRQINTAAWIQGQYVAAAINACFADNAQYPQKPLDIFGKQETDEQKELPDKHSAVEDSIRAQSAKIDAVLNQRK